MIKKHSLPVSSCFLLIPFLLFYGCNQKTDIAAYDITAKKVIIPGGDNKKIMMPDSGVYEGSYKEGLFHGNGIMVWRNKSSYEGEFLNGMFHGEGKINSINGNVYEGEFSNGLEQGQGYLKFKNGDEYKGQFVNGDFEGKGHFQEKGGNSYKGDFQKGMLTGIAEIIYKDRGTYVGEVKDWKMHGVGVYQVENKGTKYIGIFVDDIQSGKGEVIFENGGHYIGDIDKWVGNGKGKFTKKNGEYYEGEFKSGQYHGKGKIVYKNKNSYKGSFKNSLRHGSGVYVRVKPKGHKKEMKGWWEYGRYISATKPKDKKKNKNKVKVDAEKIFYKQDDLLAQAFKKLKPSEKNKPDLYMVNFAGYGKQDVFMKEAQFAKSLFDINLGTQGRSLSLINNHKVNDKMPIASVTNLERSLNYVANIMDKDEDILFLFLTSHGSQKHELSVTLSGLPLNDLSAKKMAYIIKKTKIKWKVIVVSSCYSGGFIKHLKDDYTMILTASKKDHVSFGCDDEADFTFFGRAFFKKSVKESVSFKSAFQKAQTFVHKWENEEKYDHSEPQIWTTNKIEHHLTLWRKTLSQKLADAQ